MASIYIYYYHLFIMNIVIVILFIASNYINYKEKSNTTEPS